MMNHLDDTDQSAFLSDEWKAAREQVHLLLNAIWRLESAAILGLGGFYAWFYSRGDGWLKPFKLITLGLSKPAVLFEVACLTSVPAVFAVFVLNRLKIEYAILARLGEYSKLIEGSIYRSVPLKIELAGWETYLAKHKPDDLSFRAVRGLFSNTFNGFMIITAICIMVAIINWIRLVESLIGTLVH